MSTDSRLVTMARRILDENLYVTLGTADTDGNPWVTPVYYTPLDDHDLYWVSSPTARHSRNLEARPEISAVVFDSTARPGHAEAVYMSARAERVPDDEVAVHAPRYAARMPGLRVFDVDELTGDADLRLYRARVTEHSVLVRGSDPDYGQGVDSRLVVVL